MTKIKHKILQIKGVTKKYVQGDHEVIILDNINLDVNEGEILGILGRSGSGKSTFLRIISNLIEYNSGEVLYNNQPIEEANPKISMVFQNFGLIPWLTVFDNVALGLEEQNFSKNIIKDKVLKAINLVGLCGYEEAYPKEMSGGMKQRVGFARALVIDPEVLLMDEAFSALDYLTANSLKGDLLDLWFNRNLSSIKSIIMVTHNIEEVVALCDRVIVLSSNPGKVVANIPINLPHPRDPDSQQFHAVMESLYAAMISLNRKQNEVVNNHNIQQFYPQILSVNLLFHFLETIRERMVNNNANITLIAKELQLSNDQISKLIETLLLLNFIEINGNNITISSSGNIFLEADEYSQKLIFKEHIVSHISFIKDINHRLQEHSTISKKELLAILGKKFTNKKANYILDATISWARYAGLFAYDSVTQQLRLQQSYK